MTEVAARHPLAPMLEARSVAVVGASATPDSFGEMLMQQLLRGGFDGTVYPINPNYTEVMGLPCLPGVAELPEPVDLAILGVSNARLEEQLAAAVGAGARSAVIFASCHEPPRPGHPTLAERLSAIALEAGIPVCGGNGMGFINEERGLRACGYSEPLGRGPGGITFVTHSGSAFSALLHNDRGLRMNLAVSSGLELATTMDRYLDYALGLDSTKVIALFMETVRQPDGFRAALRRAEERDVPVVALKVGRAAPAREMVAAHSGALAGEDAAYDALFDAHGVLRVRTLDEMADTLELFSAGRRAGTGALSAIHDSGGERAHLIDVAEEVGVPLTTISAATVARLSAILEPGLPAVNPLDAWGTGNDAADIFVECMHALLEDPGTGAMAFCVDLTTELISETGYTRVAADVFGTTNKPVAVLSNLAAAIDANDAAFVRKAGIPILEGTETGLRAFRHLFASRDARARPPVASRAGSGPEVRDRWLARLADPEPIDEATALSLLAEYGVPVAPTRVAETVEETIAAARELGWPVVLKTASGIAHKSDADGVVVGLEDEARVRAGYERVVSSLGPRVTVQAMSPPGVELALGIVRDAQFGPMVMVGAGGVLVEVIRDRRFGLPPLDEGRASALLDDLAVRPMLDGVRGRPATDLGSVARAIVALSDLAEDLGEHLDALDVNPLIAGPDGCVAVDALVVPRRS